MTSLEEITKIITSDLKLSVSEQIEFENQFAQLLVSNVLLNIPEQYRESVKNIANEDLNSQDQIVNKITEMGIDKDLSKQIIDDSVKKSIFEVVEKYNDVLTVDTKEKLQPYL